MRYLVSARSLLKAVIGASAIVLASSISAQVVSSGLSGNVQNTDGKPVSGAKITIVHVPTNATTTTTTGADGHYLVRNLPVGGPYTVTAGADTYHDQTQNDITTQLGADIAVNFQLTSDTVTLEKFVVQGETLALDPGLQGISNIYTSAQIEAKPSTQRSFADLVSSSPFITLRSLSGDREEAQITALGQNNRYNSVMIDGNRINDQFGLNATGLTSFFNPISFETIEQFSAQPVTYDVRYSGFTGATVNFVTKSGTNQFHGSAYYIFSGDHLAGLQMQGPDARTLVNSGTKVVPKLERTSQGFTLGGPIIPNHLFFFLNYEKFERIGAPNSAGLTNVSSADLTAIDTRVAQITKVDYGTLGGNANSVADENKKLLKLDWRINDQHRLSVRYSTTDGEVPQFGSFTTTSFGSGLNNNSTFANLVGGATTAYDSHFYSQTRKEESYSAELFSNWTSNLSTELRWSRVTQDQATPTNSIAPEIRIYNVSGVNSAGAPVTNGVVVLGTERFRHGNAIAVTTENYSANADYNLGSMVLSAGFDREDNDYYNLFRQYSYGVFDFASPTDFLNNNPRFFQRNYTDLALKGDYADISQYAQTGVYGKLKWTPTPRLVVDAGIRYDWSSSNTRPAFNQQFLTDTGMRNDGTVDGATDVSPRAGFNLALDEERTTQLRGGVGYFVGRAPWVFWSNSYGQTGAGTFTSTAMPSGGLTGYLANNFDPANPLGTGTQTASSAAEIDLADDKTHMPSTWRGNIGLDRKIAALGATFSIDLVYSVNDNTLFITNDNLKKAGTAADGRIYFAGNPGSLSSTTGKSVNGRYANYTNIYHLRNVKAGDSTYVAFSLDRPMKNDWAYNVSFTSGRSTEAQASGQTTASGMWQRNAVFNQSTQDQLFIEKGTSDFEVKNRIQATVSYQFELIPHSKTTASLYYEGRTGSPFSYAYSNDLNLDGMSGNDLIAVPTDVNDPRFDFSGLTAAQITSMFAYFDSTGLSAYAGGYAPKNAFHQPWINRLDLKLNQNIPVHFHKASLDLFLDFTNFGVFIANHLFNYVERAPSTVNDVFDRVLVGNASIVTANGKIKPTSFAPSAFAIDNTMSRWRVQVGARLRF